VPDRKMIKKNALQTCFMKCVCHMVRMIINKAQDAENLSLNNVRIINITSIDSAYSASSVRAYYCNYTTFQSLNCFVLTLKNSINLNLVWCAKRCREWILITTLMQGKKNLSPQRQLTACTKQTLHHAQEKEMWNQCLGYG